MPLDFVPMTRKVMVDGQEKTAALATLTKVVFDEKTGKSLDTLLSEMSGGSGGGGFALEKLWENEAPTAEFAAQTVPLDLSQYELFLVTTMTQIKSDGTRGELSFVAFKNVSSALQVASPGGSGPLAATRQFQILENGINFYDARSSYNNHNNQISNAFLIPHQIYGIKTSPAGATGSAITWDDIYPVGSYYYSGDAEFDPNTAFGGTWEKVAENLALRQASTEHAVGSTFGEAEHLLTADEMPAHAHNMPQVGSGSSWVASWFSAGGTISGKSQTGSGLPSTNLSGGGQAHNNIGPSLAVNIWRKTANGGKVIGQNHLVIPSIISTELTDTGEYYIHTDGKKYPVKQKRYDIPAGPKSGSLSTQLGVENVLEIIDITARWTNSFGTRRYGTLLGDSAGVTGEIAASTTAFNINVFAGKDLSSINVSVVVKMIVSGTEV